MLGRSRRAGMGVVQLFGALAVLMVLALGLYRYADYLSAEGKRELTVRRMLSLYDGLEKYLIDTGGALPTQDQGLAAMLKCPTTDRIPTCWAGPYVNGPDDLCDGWGRPFQYYCPGDAERHDSDKPRPYDLVSLGRDGREGGEGLDRDIRSYDPKTMLP